MAKVREKMEGSALDDQVTIQAPALGGSASWQDSGFGALDSEARSQSYDNLAAAAYVYAGVYFVAFWVSWALSSHVQGATFTWPETHFTIAVAPSIAMALIVARTVRKHHLPAESFTRIAQVFLVLSCFSRTVPSARKSFGKSLPCAINSRTGEKSGLSVLRPCRPVPWNYSF